MKLTIKEMAIFAMLGALMIVSKLALELLPNMHLLGMFTVTFTVVYRQKALYPIYIFVILTGLFYGFPLWWVPYLYIWAILWGVVMLLPRSLPSNLRPFVYVWVCALHGLFYGSLYAPAQALLFGLDLKGMLAWIVAGLPWDGIHGVSNLFAGLLIYPLVLLLTRLNTLFGVSSQAPQAKNK